MKQDVAAGHNTPRAHSKLSTSLTPPKKFNLIKWPEGQGYL